MAQTSSEKLKHTGPAKKERVAAVSQRAVGKYARAVRPDHQFVRWETVTVAESRTVTRERIINIKRVATEKGREARRSFMKRKV